MNQNATRADIITLLSHGHSNLRIARELHCDKNRVARLREKLDLPAYTPIEQTRTLEDKWAGLTRPLADGHVAWTGERATASGTPVLRYKEQTYSRPPSPSVSTTTATPRATPLRTAA